ncbi:MAG: LPS export ABC transporter periplasmic protein LptC [Deltaproteobacteria bacterium]|nr:LPS export ABC transporter periplasmic protein LptC [Deltaproteobacteria bacterium]
MNRKIRIFLLAFIALSIIGLIVLVLVHYQTKNSYQVSFTEDSKLEVKIDKIHYSGTKNGRVEWELTADSAKRTRDEDLTLFDTVQATFYSKQGKTYTLKADEGRYKEIAGEIHAVGDVSVESEEGYTLKTEELKYSIGSREITSDKRVEITSEGMDVEGEGFFADVENGRYLLKDKVRAVFKGSAS